jgi:hypothetical protein
MVYFFTRKTEILEREGDPDVGELPIRIALFTVLKGEAEDRRRPGQAVSLYSVGAPIFYKFLIFLIFSFFIIFHHFSIFFILNFNHCFNFSISIK